MTRKQTIATIVVIAVVALALAIIIPLALVDEEPEQPTTQVEVEQEPQEDEVAVTDEEPTAGEGAGPERPREGAGNEINITIRTDGGDQTAAQPGQADRTQDEKAVTRTEVQTAQLPRMGVNKPKMYEFSAEWCPPCQQMKPIISDLKNNYGNKVEIVTIDVDANPALAKKYNVSVIPTQLFYDRDGNQVARHEGFYPRDEIIAQFNEMGANLR